MSRSLRSMITGACFVFFSSFAATAQYEDDSTIGEDTRDSVAAGEYKTDKEETKFLSRSEYTGEPLSVQQRTVPDSLVKKLQEEDAFWYANTVIEKEKVKDPGGSYTPLTQRPWFQTLIWLIIIGGFATFLVIYLSGNNIFLFRRKNLVTTGGEEELETGDIFVINYQREIDKAAAQGNYRLAIRLMFLRLLKNMSERNIIKYQQDKTNLDYLLQLHGTGYYPGFFQITRNYEYSWYGKFDVSEEAYGHIRKDVDHFESRLK